MPACFTAFGGSQALRVGHPALLAGGAARRPLWSVDQLAIVLLLSPWGAQIG